MPLSSLEKINRVLDGAARMTETELRRFYVAKCTATILDTRLFIRNVGKFDLGERGWIVSGIAGQADVYGWLYRKPWPVPLEIECKNVRTRETDEQRAWKAYCDMQNVSHLELRAKKNETPRQVIDRWISVTDEWLDSLRRRAI